MDATAPQVVDLGSWITPETTGLDNVGDGDEDVDVKCPGGPSWRGVDYMHQSSAGPGSDDNLVSSLRNLNAILSLKDDGSGVDWIVSSDPSLSTDYDAYRFAREGDKFYYPHHITQLPTGNVMLMDDALGRPGCAQGSEKECYTRAAEYAFTDGALTADGTFNGTVELVWQFAYPDNFTAYAPADDDLADDVTQGATDSATDAAREDLDSKIGNSVSKLSNGHYVVGFTVLHGGGPNSVAFADIMDVDDGGHLHASMRIRNVSFFGDGAYRALPYESVYGESRHSPFGDGTTTDDDAYGDAAAGGSSGAAAASGGASGVADDEAAAAAADDVATNTQITTRNDRNDDGLERRQ